MRRRRSLMRCSPWESFPGLFFLSFLLHLHHALFVFFSQSVPRSPSCGAHLIMASLKGSPPHASTSGKVQISWQGYYQVGGLSMVRHLPKGGKLYFVVAHGNSMKGEEQGEARPYTPERFRRKCLMTLEEKKERWQGGGL